MPVSSVKIITLLSVVVFSRVGAFIPSSSSLSSLGYLTDSTQLFGSGGITPDSDSENVLSRREIIILGIGGTAYAKVVASAVSKIKRGDAYPPEHENRVSHIFERAVLEASSNASNGRPLRVLEVGIGDKCRTIVRGMYDETLLSIAKLDNPPPIELVGVDVEAPVENVVKNANQYLSDKFPSISISLMALEGDIVQGLKSFSDGYFDAVTSSLVLCSVSDQGKALTEIKRLMNPNGGVFGYVEHVAVNLENETEKSLSSLEWQQRTLDPLQQAVAHNCHLHRRTDDIISKVFGLDTSLGSACLLESERFLCEEMWPVSMQSCGVVKVTLK